MLTSVRPATRWSLSVVLALFGLASVPAGCASAAPTDDGPKKDAGHDAASDSGGGTDTTPPPEETGLFDTALPPEDTTPEDTHDAADITCPLDQYDVDGDPTNGCEFKETVSNHTLATAYSMGDVDECDSSYDWIKVSNMYASDERMHGKALEAGINGRPQFITARHVSKTLCVDDPVYQIAISGGKGTYRVSLYRHGDLSQLDTKCSPQNVGGAETTINYACTGQDDGELAVIKIEKVSGPREKVSYTLQYHN